MISEEPPYKTIAWYFFEIDEKEKELQSLLSHIKEEINQMEDILKEINDLKAQMEVAVNVGKI